MSDFLSMIPYILGGALIIVILLILIRALYEPFTLESSSVLLTDSYEEDILDQAETSTLRLVFFSDLHANISPLSDKKILAAVFAEPSDMILFGGDITSRTSSPAAGIHRLQRIAEEATKRGIPCYAVRGNHDGSIDKSILLSSGFRFLENESVSYMTADGVRYRITGLSDSGKENRIWPSVPMPRDKDTESIPRHRHICLVHNPEYIVKMSGLPYKYQLSGHFHGGQIYMPFHLEYKLFRSETVASEGMYKGIFRKNGVVGYITRGVGCVLFPLRLFSKPEITHITIKELS